MGGPKIDVTGPVDEGTDAEDMGEDTDAEDVGAGVEGPLCGVVVRWGSLTGVSELDCARYVVSARLAERCEVRGDLRAFRLVPTMATDGVDGGTVLLLSLRTRG